MKNSVFILPSSLLVFSFCINSMSYELIEVSKRDESETQTYERPNTYNLCNVSSGNKVAVGGHVISINKGLDGLGCGVGYRSICVSVTYDRQKNEVFCDSTPVGLSKMPPWVPYDERPFTFSWIRGGNEEERRVSAHENLCRYREIRIREKEISFLYDYEFSRCYLAGAEKCNSVNFSEDGSHLICSRRGGVQIPFTLNGERITPESNLDDMARVGTEICGEVGHGISKYTKVFGNGIFFRKFKSKCTIRGGEVSPLTRYRESSNSMIAIECNSILIQKDGLLCDAPGGDKLLLKYKNPPDTSSSTGESPVDSRARTDDDKKNVESEPNVAPIIPYHFNGAYPAN